MTCYNSYTYGQRKVKAGSLINLIFTLRKSILNSPHWCSSLGVEKVLLCLIVSVWQCTIIGNTTSACRTATTPVWYEEKPSPLASLCVRENLKHEHRRRWISGYWSVWSNEWLSIANVFLFMRLYESFQLLFYAHYHCDSDCASVMFQFSSRFTYLK